MYFFDDDGYEKCKTVMQLRKKLGNNDVDYEYECQFGGNCRMCDKYFEELKLLTGEINDKRNDSKIILIKGIYMHSGEVIIEYDVCGEDFINGYIPPKHAKLKDLSDKNFNFDDGDGD